MRILAAVALAVAAAVFASTAPDEPAVPVFLNHFFVVADAGTYAAARSSPFLAGEFAPYESRTTVRADMSYTGLYWYGRRTYFEMLQAGSMGAVGSSGIALGVEQPQASAAVAQGWALAPDASLTITRKTDGADVPWFRSTSPPEAPGLALWLMEYEPEFLSRWYPGLTPARSIARADVLDRYVAKVGATARRESALLRDVVELTVALVPAARETLSARLRSVGWTVRAESSALVLEGPEAVCLRLVDPGSEPPGVVEAAFSLQHPAAPATHRLGAAELRLEGSAARLRFRARR